MDMANYIVSIWIEKNSTSQEKVETKGSEKWKWYLKIVTFTLHDYNVCNSNKNSVLIHEI